MIQLYEAIIVTMILGVDLCMLWRHVKADRMARQKRARQRIGRMLKKLGVTA